MANFNSPDTIPSGTYDADGTASSMVQALQYTLGSAANKDVGTMPGQVVSTDDPQYLLADTVSRVKLSYAGFF